MVTKLRAALIGCGKIVLQKHIPAMLYHKDRVEIAGFCDVDEDTAYELAAEYGTRDAIRTSDYRQILEDKNIDLVHICTPNSTHAEITIAALEAGKHVMCEKPMAHTAEAAKKMADAAKRTGKKLSISYQNRFRSDSLAVHQYCENGDLGEIYFAKAHALRRKSVPNWGVFTQLKAQGGGPLIDIGTHALDLTLWHMNNYDVHSVTGSCFQKMKDNWDGNTWGPWDPERFEVEDSAFGMVKMKNGATVMVESSWALNMLEVKEAVTTVCGTLGGAAQYIGAGGPGTYTYAVNTARYGDLVTIRPDHPSKYSASCKESGNEVMVDAPRREMDQWLDCILNNRAPVVLPEQGYTVSLILEAIYSSAATGKTVYFD